MSRLLDPTCPCHVQPGKIWGRGSRQQKHPLKVPSNQTGKKNTDISITFSTEVIWCLFFVWTTKKCRKMNEALFCVGLFLAKKPTIKEYSMAPSTLSGLAETLGASNSARSLQQPPLQQISCDIKKKSSLAMSNLPHPEAFPKTRGLILLPKWEWQNWLVAYSECHSTQSYFGCLFGSLLLQKRQPCAQVDEDLALASKFKPG